MVYNCFDKKAIKKGNAAKKEFMQMFNELKNYTNQLSGNLRKKVNSSFIDNIWGVILQICIW